MSFVNNVFNVARYWDGVVYGDLMLPLLERNIQPSQRPFARAKAQKPEQFAVTTCAENPEFFDACVALENEIWEDLSFLEYTSAHHAHYDNLLARFPEFHMCVVEMGSGELVATGTCVPLKIASDAVLPHEGWDWIVDTVQSQNGAGANTLGALSVSVSKQHRDLGLARDMIDAMRALAARKKISKIIVPVRPSAKCDHPFVPMDQYVDWLDDRGRIFDPWLRSHVAVGGRIMGVCDRSMIVEQPVEFWKSWTRGNLDQDGRVPVKGALAPVDIKAGVGRYVEPNVWVAHSV